jgi:Family of unknown function (DUF6516)
MRIEEYFRQVDAMITLCSRVVLKTMLYDERSETKGFIRGLLHFDDGSELHIREFVDVSTGIERYKYSYHYMRAGRLMFRYDNSADITARDLATYPHHKHRVRIPKVFWVVCTVPVSNAAIDVPMAKIPPRAFSAVVTCSALNSALEPWVIEMP